jgi:hypothetical protein
MRGGDFDRPMATHWTLLLGLAAVGACAQPEETPRVIPLHGESGLAVELAFGERSAWFMLDTGAGAHTFARWFVDAAGIPTEAAAQEDFSARDATGQAVELQVLRELVGRLPEGQELVLGPGIVTDFPPHFEETNTGGLINPQLLAGDGYAVVLDPHVPELRFESFQDAVDRLGGWVLPEEDVDICVVADAPVPNLLFAVKVRRDGREGWLQLDTGSGTTAVVEGSPLGEELTLEPGGEVMGVGGGTQRYSIAPDQMLRFGEYTRTVDLQVVERGHGGCGPDGLVGRDILGGCALILSENFVGFACK